MGLYSGYSDAAPRRLHKWFEEGRGGSIEQQLYSRVGFAHEYRPRTKEDLHFVLQRRWRILGRALDPEGVTDAQAVAAIARMTRGNIRFIDRVFAQMQRVMKINELSTITDDVVEAVRSILVIVIVIS